MLQKIKLALIALLIPLVAFGQSYPSPTFNNLTVQGTATLANATVTGTFTATGNIGLPALAAQAANTVVANVTASSASPTAVSLPSCSASNSALKYTSGTGFVCGTTFALTSGTLAQFSSTTSAQLAGVISDGTGTGSLVFGTAPTISNLNATGTPTAPTATTGTNTTQIASTAFVNASITAGATSGRLLNVQVFTSSGTYTPTTGTNHIIVEVQAPGGGSGGNPATSSGQNAVSGGGAAGSYARVFYSSASTQTVTIGAAGTAGAAGANAGGAGGTTSFGSLISCPGGPGGSAGIVSTNPGEITAASGFAGAPTISGGVTLNTSVGQEGGQGVIFVLSSTLTGGNGGSSMLGQAGLAGYVGGAIIPGKGYGAGASGGRLTPSQSAIAGAPGAAAIVIVWEFS